MTFILVACDRINWLRRAAHRDRLLPRGCGRSKVGRRIPPVALRGLILVIGVVAIVKLVCFP